MPDFGMNMALVGNKNRSTILNYINKKGSASRKEIAEATSLTAAAVTQISQGLIKDGVLEETGILNGTGAGRKQVGLKINYKCKYVFSVNIEQAHTVIALCDMRGEAENLTEIETDHTKTPEEFLLRIAGICKKLLAKASDEVKEKTESISVGIPGIVDSGSGTAVHAYGIWDESVNVVEILSRATGLHCIVSNNVNAFAQASSIYGIGKKYDNMLIIKWGPGVGGTILVDNKVYDGRHGKAAEIGHYIVAKNGPACNCGRRGCLETKVSFSALNRILSFKEGGFNEAFSGADEKQKKDITESLDLFARSIVNTVTVLAPDRVVLCGFMFKEEKTRELLIQKVAEYDKALAEHRILYTMLYDKEEYIGPVAAYVYTLCSGGGPWGGPWGRG